MFFFYNLIEPSHIYQAFGNPLNCHHLQMVLTSPTNNSSATFTNDQQQQQQQYQQQFSTGIDFQLIIKIYNKV